MELDYRTEAEQYLLEARAGGSAVRILNSTKKLEEVLYQKKLKPIDVGTDYREIRGLKSKAYSHECLHWLRIIRRKNSFSAIQKFEEARIKGGLSYRKVGTSRLEMGMRKLFAKFFSRKTFYPSYY